MAHMIRLLLSMFVFGSAQPRVALRKFTLTFQVVAAITLFLLGILEVGAMGSLVMGPGSWTINLLDYFRCARYRGSGFVVCG